MYNCYVYKVCLCFHHDKVRNYTTSQSHILIYSYFVWYCYVTACDGLYQEAVQFMEKSNSQSNLVQQLEIQLNQSQSEDIVEAGKIAAVKHALQNIQAEIEVVYLTIKKRQEAIKKSTSKLPCRRIHKYIMYICIQLLVSSAPTCAELLLQIRLKFKQP